MVVNIIFLMDKSPKNGKTLDVGVRMGRPNRRPSPSTTSRTGSSWPCWSTLLISMDVGEHPRLVRSPRAEEWLTPTFRPCLSPGLLPINSWVKTYDSYDTYSFGFTYSPTILWKFQDFCGFRSSQKRYLYTDEFEISMEIVCTSVPGGKHGKHRTDVAFPIG